MNRIFSPNFFTDLMRALLKILIVLVIIVSIGLGFGVGGEIGFFWGLMVFVMSFCLGIVLISVFGVFVELCDNVKNIKEKLNVIEIRVEGISERSSGSKNGESSSNRFSYFTPAPSAPPTTISRSPKSTDYTWTCEFCGTGNIEKAFFCEKCHQKRTELKEIPAGKWRCSSCYTLQEEGLKKCSYCGVIRINYSPSSEKNKPKNENENNKNSEPLQTVKPVSSPMPDTNKNSNSLDQPKKVDTSAYNSIPEKPAEAAADNQQRYGQPEQPAKTAAPFKYDIPEYMTTPETQQGYGQTEQYSAETQQGYGQTEQYSAETQQGYGQTEQYSAETQQGYGQTEQPAPAETTGQTAQSADSFANNAVFQTESDSSSTYAQTAEGDSYSRLFGEEYANLSNAPKILTCKHCGQMVDEGYKFCIYCGNPI